MALDYFEAIDWKKGEIPKEMKGKTFVSCQFSDCDFTGLDLSKGQFLQSTFIRCQWVETKVVGSRFQEVLFTESKIMGVDFSLVDPKFLSLGFLESILMGCNFSGLSIARARFHKSKVNDYHFSERASRRLISHSRTSKGVSFTMSI